jgi:hypothetical protein
MNKLIRDNKGFSIVEGLLVLLTLAVIGVAGYFVSKHIDTKKTTTTTTTATTITNPYAGWKDYCDITVKLCFKYPSTWTDNDGSITSVGTIQTVINATSTADVQYGNLLPASGEPAIVFTSDPLSQLAPPANTTIDTSGTFSFYISYISNLANNDSNYKVLGGYYMGAGENIPSDFVVNTSTITKLSLKAGQVSQLQDKAFNISSSLKPNNIIIIGGGPITTNVYTPSQAATWLTSTVGQATLQLLQSFHSE